MPINSSPTKKYLMPNGQPKGGLGQLKERDQMNNLKDN